MKEKTKKFWAWFIGIFLICSGVTYFNQILVPALLVFIAGIAILPPINKKIKSKFVEKYSWIKMPRNLYKSKPNYR